MDIDDNLRSGDDGVVHCRHCEGVLGVAAEDPMARGVRRISPAVDAGPGVHADPAHYTAREIVLRQIFCPGCYALLATEIVPRDEAELRGWRIDA